SGVFDRKVELFLLGLLEAGRYRKDAQGFVSVGLHSGRDGRRDRRCALDALSIQGEEYDEQVGHLHGADARCVADAGATVDEDVVVLLAQAFPLGMQQLSSAETFVEVVPIERIHALRIIFVLSARGDEVNRSSTVEIPVQPDHVILERWKSGWLRGR